MRTTIIIAAFGLVALIGGCVRSLHPLFNEEDLVFEPSLVGTWSEEDDEDTWSFQKSGENAYDLIVTEGGLPAGFDAKLGRLGSYLFLDLYPQEPDIKNDFYKFHLIPAHTFSRVWIEEDTLHLSMLDNDWLRDMIDQGELNIEHERLDGGIVLTTATDILQEFVVRHAEDDRAFPVPGKLLRQD